MIKLITITELLVAIVIIFVFCLMIYYFYSKLLLEGFSRELYESKINIENFVASKPNPLEDAKDLAKMNIQTLHSFLVMLIAVVALILSLYNLLKPANPFNTTTSELPFSALSILIFFFLLVGISIIIFIINYRWYKIYIKLTNLKDENIIMQSNDKVIISKDWRSIDFALLLAVSVILFNKAVSFAEYWLESPLGKFWSSFTVFGLILVIWIILVICLSKKYT